MDVVIVNEVGNDIRVTTEGSVCSIMLCRDRKRNALAATHWRFLSGVLDDIGSTSSCRAVLLSATGKAFCAGFDLTASSDVPGHQGDEVLHVVDGVLEKLRSLRVPTVATVEGAAIGAGMALAIACDFVIAGSDAFFEAPRAERGLVPDVGVAWFLERRLGHQRAMSMSLLGERLSAEAAYNFGLVSEVAPSGATEDVARRMLQRLCSLPQVTARVTKTLLNLAAESNLATVTAAEPVFVGLNSGSESARKARDSFLRR